MFRARVSKAIVGAIACVATIGVTAAPAFAATSAVTAKPITRLAGASRIDTAIAISRQEFATDHSAKNVVLTAAYTFADAMSAGPLGKTLTAPLLLTTPGLLDGSTLTEIQRVMPLATASTPGTTTAGCTSTPPDDAVYVIGGYAAIAQEIDTQLNQAGFNVVRIADEDRFATSVAVARCEGSPSTVFLA